jgi:5'-methylthioadenosine phosphorylase
LNAGLAKGGLLPEDLPSMERPEPAIGVIGGSGLYQMADITGMEEIPRETPFGKPSDAVISGRLGGRRVFFLPRHGRGHRLLPHELPHRANMFALRELGVRWLICVTAVGSLRENLEPRHIVLPDQIYDHTSRRPVNTFFGNGIAAHVSLADPYSKNLRDILDAAAKDNGYVCHNGGTYINMDGPAFSTRAESEIYRHWGCDVIGMTNAPEVRLAREAEIALATLCMVTDYDCWRHEEEPVSVDAVIANLMANADNAQALIREAVDRIPLEPDWPEHSALEHSLVTDRKLWPPETVENLRPIIQRFLDGE